MRSATAAFGGLVLPPDAFGVGGKPLVRMGVLSDVHMGGALKGDELFLRQLRFMDDQKVDLVLLPGDLSNVCFISEFETVVSCWNKVFPNGRAADGRKVERVVVTGNHDATVKYWDGFWSRYTPAQQEKMRFLYKGNEKRLWRQWFDEEFELCWKKEVCGLTFVGSQFDWLNPPKERFFAEHGREIDPSMPFVYVQHAHPQGTCHGDFVARYADDDGVSTRMLSSFPNAIAFSGHSHVPVTDDRFVWQGAFTSIGCGACGLQVPTGLGGQKHANSGIPMGLDWPQLNRPLLTQSEGRCGLVVDLFRDHLVIERWSMHYFEPLAGAISVPLPAAVDGPYDFKRCRARRKAPEFAADARAKLEFFEKAPAEAGTDYRGKKSCWRLTFPSALPVDGSRVFDYEITIRDQGRDVLKRKLLSFGFHKPLKRAACEEFVFFGTEEIPPRPGLTYDIVPYECYGAGGRPLTGTFPAPPADSAETFSATSATSTRNRSL